MQYRMNLSCIRNEFSEQLWIMELVHPFGSYKAVPDEHANLTAL